MRTPIINRRRVQIRVSQNACLDMFYSALEAALVPPEMTPQSLNLLAVWDRSRNRKRVHSSPLPPSLVFSQSGLEAAGILAGRSEIDGDQIVYRVERVFPVSAWQTDHAVGHSCRSAELLDEMADALNFPFEVVGGFHSHPLCEFELADIEHEKRFLPSVGDLNSPPIFWGHEINVVVSVAKAGELRPIPHEKPGPIIQMRVGDFEFWVVAHRHQDDAVVLEIDTQGDIATLQMGGWRRRPPPPF